MTVLETGCSEKIVDFVRTLATRERCTCTMIARLVGVRPIEVYRLCKTKNIHFKPEPQFLTGESLVTRIRFRHMRLDTIRRSYALHFAYLDRLRA